MAQERTAADDLVLSGASVLATSPTNAQLSNAGAGDLVRLAVRCFPTGDTWYCLHLGIFHSEPDIEALAKAAEDEAAAAARGEDLGSGRIVGADLWEWASLPYQERVDREHAEVKEIVESLSAAKATDDYGILAAPTSYALMTSSKMSKQEASYYCGPTSVQTIAWNNPGGDVYKSQASWASILKTTSSGGTDLEPMRVAINNYTTWDSAAGTYQSHWGMHSKTDAQLRTFYGNRRFGPTIHWVHLRKGSTTSYYGGNTSGHYNVGRGYDFNSTANGGIIRIFEPAGGPANNNYYPSKTANETIFYLKKALGYNGNGVIIGPQ
ncbi:hypothetical protein [Micromonospora gifhornensis]|uniref:hypothetical protein n=1 Tax=Micromonospora gifhornensis TaxID=84594 RepID=UPI003D72D852